MTQAYKFNFDEIRDLVERHAQALEAKGKEPLPTFIKSIESIVAQRGGYKKFGVYWFAMKAVLKNYGNKSLGQYSVKWLEDEYTLADDAGTPRTMTPAMVLVAGYEFAQTQGYLGAALNVQAQDEYTIDGVLWSVEDEDMK